jgi:hypothetical protein
MKKLTLVIAMMMLVALSCTKQASNQLATMTVEQLKVKTGIDLIAAWDIQFGAMRGTPNVKRPNKNDAVTLVEGSFAWDGGSFTTVDNPKFAGVNNQTLITSACNWFFYEGGSAQTLTCGNSTGSGQIMAWYTDWNNNVYRSNLITVP